MPRGVLLGGGVVMVGLLAALVLAAEPAAPPAGLPAARLPLGPPIAPPTWGAASPLASTGPPLRVAPNSALIGDPGGARGLAPAVTIRANLGAGLAWSPDGRILATAAPAGPITLWDPQTGQVLRTIAAGRAPLAFLGWTPDGRLLEGRVPDDSPVGQEPLTLWDATTGQVAGTVPGAGNALSLAWSPDGRVLAWSDGFFLSRWDRSSGRPLPKPQPTWPAPLVPPGDAGIGPVAWSPDGRMLSGIQGPFVKLWDPLSGQELGAFAHQGRVTGMAWAPDGRHLAVSQAAGQSSAETVVLWDVASRRQGAVLTSGPAGSPAGAQSLTWLDAGAVLAVIWQAAEQHNQMTLYDRATGQILRTIPVAAGDPRLAPDGQALAIADTYDSVLTIWRPQIGTPAPTRAPPGPTATAGCGPGWQVVTGAGNGQTSGMLEGVAALASGDVWAVGATGPFPGDNALIEHWNGQSWNTVRNPSVSGGPQHLHGITALAPDDIWVVGDYGASSATNGDTAVQTLVEHWDGKRWSLVASPDATPLRIGADQGPHGSGSIPGAPISSLLAVAAGSPRDVWAVGYAGDTNHGDWNQPLVEHWDGQAWRIVPASVPLGGRLSGVVALAANDAWIVGSGGDPGEGDPFILHWDGTSWHVVPALDRPHVWLTGIAAVSAHDIWVAGYQMMQAGNDAAITLHWDGRAWRDLSPARPGDNAHPMTVVAAGDQVWAAGRELLQRAGGQWLITPAPGIQPNGGQDWDYHGVRAVAAQGRSAWAVGDDGADHPLVLRYRQDCGP